jgi:hypothetical protein
MGYCQTSRMHTIVSLAEVAGLPEVLEHDAVLEGVLWLECGIAAGLPDQLERPGDACPMGTRHDRQRKFVDLA